MRDNRYFVDCVGPGWQPTIKELIDKIEELKAEYKSSAIEIHQVKEKFGQLRFYCSYDGPEEFVNKVSAAIKNAKNKCNSSCEECGEPGELRYTRWLKTLCDKHYKITHESTE